MYNEIDKTRSVKKFREKKDDKGNVELVPVFLTETPEEEIERQNKLFRQWKSTKQVKYDKSGMRVKK